MSTTTRIVTRTAGYRRTAVYAGGVYKGYVVSFLGAFGAFNAKGERILDGGNQCFTLKREAIAAVASV